MTIKNIALINEHNQVVNHVIADTEDASVMEMLFREWNAVRYVETVETDDIVLNPDPEIWTIHTDENGFVPPPPIVVEILPPELSQNEVETVIINGRTYPKDSRLIKENSHLRPEGWILPEGEVEVSLADAE